MKNIEQTRAADNDIIGKVSSRFPIEEISYPTEEIILFIRNLGLNKIKSIRIISKMFNLTLSESKKIIHLSNAWGDRKDIDDRLHEEVIKHLDEL